MFRNSVLVSSLALWSLAASLASAPVAHAADAAAPAVAMPVGSIADHTMWDLTDLYATPQAWDASYASTKAAADKLGEFKGTLGK
ncbi:MAG: hypothetical protein ACRES2_10070, partial [Steroidobacteraceae bacterium]